VKRTKSLQLQGALPMDPIIILMLLAMVHPLENPGSTLEFHGTVEVKRGFD